MGTMMRTFTVRLLACLLISAEPERDPHSKQLTDAEAAKWATKTFLSGSDGWNPTP